MKHCLLISMFVCLCASARAQDTNAFTAPPTIETPAITQDVVVVAIETNVIVRTNVVQRHVAMVVTNATLRRFVIDIDANQLPTRFTSYLSDGSVVVTAAGSVASLTNRLALSTFNGLLRDVIANGQRNVNTNTAWQVHGAGPTGRVQRVLGPSGGRR